MDTFNIIPILLAAFVYLIPSIIAKTKNKHNKIKIYFINFFLGWLLFGWFAALYLSLKKDDRDHPLAVKKLKV
ncbi:superinfection immunity protein [Bacillus salacetis]|uniref:superinfection immunity protein n=1 Tax=Bacillus salacetis TaxID=2315464 RepID=UPI001F0C815A|nr:superinfection immunity protein [Bacillus salacetis]